MSKINAVRFININYNNNAIRISDECFHFNGESTLLSLRNGGGKSVLVQMMTAPFVHKRYRDTKDRPFESYFTTNKPSFILVEWVLDQGAGFVMTGMMVRRSQDLEDGNIDNLEMINMISEYREPCLADIHHLPVVEKGKKEMVLKNFASCRQIFESFKKDRALKFYYYNMNNSAQSRQYFDKLKEYQINDKEWETIIKKVNLKESGLSDLFSECKDEKGLVEKWFLEAVESKLNKNKNRMKEFQVILEKYVGQYKDNQSKFKRRDTIRIFQEEAVSIQESSQQYQETNIQEKHQENKVASFIETLNQLDELTQEEYRNVIAQGDEIREAIAFVEYEKISSEIHQLEKEILFHTSDRDMISVEQETLEREAQDIEYKLNLLLCAKQQGAVDEKKTDLEEIRQKLFVSRKKDEDMEPERNYLGYSLRCHYERELQDNKVKLDENKERITQNFTDIVLVKEKKFNLEENNEKSATKLGTLNSNVESFNAQEEQYNTRYKEDLTRNILGEYEPGALEIRQQTYKKELEELTRERLKKKKQTEAISEKLHGLERSLEDLWQEEAQTKFDHKQQENIKISYDEELENRKVILQYIELDKKHIFDSQKILHILERKLQEIAGFRRNLEKEENELLKEYQQLSSGKVLELPEDLEEAVKNLGIHVVYGMEWLKKNGYSKQQNQKLVRSHPFLPYALIISKKELDKLSGSIGEIYTSSPIPIIVREELEQVKEPAAGNLVTLQGVNFYVLFNENLLDEEKLSTLINEKEKLIQKKKEAIAIRQMEYAEYFGRQETIKNQKVNKELFEENQRQIDELLMALEEYKKKILNINQELSEQKKTKEQLETEIQKTQQEIVHKERRLEDYTLLMEAYAVYEKNRQELEQCKKEISRIKEQLKLSENQLERLSEREKALETESDNLAGKRKELSHFYQIYDAYTQQGHIPNTLAEDDLNIEQMEARYNAITGNLSMELKELEQQEQKEVKRYEEALEELEHLRNKYDLKEGVWLETIYSKKEELHQESKFEDRRRKIEGKKNLWNEANKQIAVKDSKKGDRIQKMQNECKKEFPLPIEEIQNYDFDSRRNQLRYKEQEIQKKADSLKARLQSYNENLTALSEYSEVIIMEPFTWEQDIGELNSKELRNLKGILIRDLNQSIEEKHKAREKLTRVLNRIVRMDVFQEDFYKKPLESMLELVGDASLVLDQLDTTIKSYLTLMEKLEVDISLIEKEKNKIVELMEDYIKDVHENLGKIDYNSTITIRERPIKMLKIQLPEWEENESLYHIRLQDMIDEITKKGIDIFERNENAQEYFGTQLTTKNLYDTVIGLGNVSVRLFKIEEQREYPITWAEVAKNSGGEGFLSAFVILSSLLYYMRKDDTDIFADRNEGKVLLMDNPFAQTNASHLLKPLMEMAKKTNTQLICLTGLGGESIYNRFDNIYVLTLISASLRNGMQYLKTDHLRGNETEAMIVSQIEVIEQQELVF